VVHPGPLRAQVKALDLLDVPPGCLRAQAEVKLGGRILLGCLTAQVCYLTVTVVGDGNGGLEGPQMSLVVEND